MPKSEYFTKQRIKSTEQRVTAETALKKLQHEHDDLQHSYSALRIMNEEQDKIIKDYIAREEREGLYYTINNDSVTSITIVPAYRNFTYMQNVGENDIHDIIAMMSSSLYARFPYIEVCDRQLRINEIKFNDYKLGGLL